MLYRKRRGLREDEKNNLDWRCPQNQYGLTSAEVDAMETIDGEIELRTRESFSCTPLFILGNYVYKVERHRGLQEVCT